MDFKDMVKAGLDSGKSIYDIAIEMTNALNETQRELENEDSKDTYINKIDEEFWSAVDSQCLDKDDVAKLALLVYADDHPEWSKETAEQFCKQVKGQLNLLARTVDADMEKAFDKLLEAMDEELKDIDNNSKKSKDHLCSCGALGCTGDKAHSKVPSLKDLGDRLSFEISDGDAIKKFFESIGLK